MTAMPVDGNQPACLMVPQRVSRPAPAKTSVYDLPNLAYTATLLGLSQRHVYNLCRDPADIPWGDAGVDYVVEASGMLTLMRHLPPCPISPL